MNRLATNNSDCSSINAAAGADLLRGQQLLNQIHQNQSATASLKRGLPIDIITIDPDEEDVKHSDEDHRRPANSHQHHEHKMRDETSQPLSQLSDSSNQSLRDHKLTSSWPLSASTQADHQDRPTSQQQQQQLLGDNNSNRPKRNPFCSRCRNHGKSAQVKGHKRHCEYRDCQCEGCKLVECRQIVSAAQIRRRRYQKQDEECGRRIEVSPPVLSRNSISAGDPAALIAKTLTGTSVPIRRSMSPVSSLIHQKSAQVITSTSTSTSSSTNGATGATNHTNQQLGTRPAHHQHPLTWRSVGAMDQQHQQHELLDHNNLQPQPQHHQFYSQLHSQQPLALSNHGHPAVLSGAMMTPAAAAAVVTSASSPLTAEAGTPTPPSGPDQMQLVEELHRLYGGPLAIYAWLRAELFDIQRVRNLIEASKTSFNDLVLSQADSKSQHNHHHNNNNNNQSSNSNNINSSSAKRLRTSNGVDDGPHRASQLDSEQQQQQPQQQNQPRAITTTTAVTSPTSSISSMPPAPHHNVLWPGALKLQGLSPSAGALLHPHLLPHFMHHHHSLLAHHHHHQQQQQQQQQQSHHLSGLSSLTNGGSASGGLMSAASYSNTAAAALSSAMLQATSDGR